ELLLDVRRDLLAVVIMHLQAEGTRAARDRLPDAAHADDAEPLAPDAVPEHPGRRPAAPLAVGGEHGRALGEPAWHGEDQRHRHVRGVLGEYARRVGHRDAALKRA